MLVINNGAIKSGSTWLHNILVNLRAFDSPPERYCTGRNPKHPCIRPERLAEFLTGEDVTGRDFISKNHYQESAQRDLLLGHPAVVVFDIERDARDVIVSNYYHDQFRNGYEGSFADYYWERGRELVSFLAAYHKVWEPDGERVVRITYEGLHRNFAQEARCVATALGLELGEAEAESLREKTSIKTLRKDYQREPRFEGERFFRKGEIGDWKNHFDERMLSDVEEIAARPVAQRAAAGGSIGRRLRKLFSA